MIKGVVTIVASGQGPINFIRLPIIFQFINYIRLVLSGAAIWSKAKVRVCLLEKRKGLRKPSCSN